MLNMLKMFAKKFVISTALLLLVSAVYLQLNKTDVKDAKFPETAPEEKSSISTSTLTTTTTPDSEPTTPPVSIPTTHTQPFPAPTAGSWNASCILLNMAAQWNFTYERKDGSFSQGLYNLPSTAKLGYHSCDSETAQQMELIWGPISSVNSFRLEFNKENGRSVLTMIGISMDILPKDFPDAKEKRILLVHRSQGAFITPEQKSYYCNRIKQFNLTESIDDLTNLGMVTISQVQVEAFRQANANGFSTVHDCDDDSGNFFFVVILGLFIWALGNGGHSKRRR